MRTASAVVMLAVAGFALWQGRWVFGAFVVAVGLGVGRTPVSARVIATRRDGRASTRPLSSNANFHFTPFGVVTIHGESVEAKFLARKGPSG